MSTSAVSGSFRDPSGFVYRSNGVLLRQVQPVYESTWRALESSGLYQTLVQKGAFVRVEEVPLEFAATEGAALVLKPEEVPFVSYPYEWSFSQLRDAALLTLHIMQDAICNGFSLRDASAFNIQFVRGKPIFIDSLSLGEYSEGLAWPAYGQFCRHFLAPLALMSFVDGRLSQLMRVHLDGIPLDLASKLLPATSKLSLGLNVHLHLHAKAQSKPANSSAKTAHMSKQALLGMVSSLESTIKGLRPPSGETVWGHYYDATNYSQTAFQSKKDLVRGYLAESGGLGIVWDLGANNGAFSELAAEFAEIVVAWDMDPQAVESGYLHCKQEGIERVLPLLQDLTNPSPGLGWRHRERPSQADRGPADLVMALALIHHLAIANNVPMPSILEWLGELAPRAIVEFVPKSDSQVQKMLSSRDDIFTDYSIQGFEGALEGRFKVIRKDRVAESERTLYLIERT